MNLNTFFSKLTNFKIKFTEDPTPVEVSNADILFFLGGKRIEFNTIMYDPDTGFVVMEFKHKHPDYTVL